MEDGYGLRDMSVVDTSQLRDDTLWPKADLTNLPRTIWWEVDPSDGIAGVYLVDQTRLPLQGDVLCCRTMEGVCLAIKSLALRGAPALGVGAAMAVAIWSENESTQTTVESYLTALDEAARTVAQSRPTAVNLSWGTDRIKDFAHTAALTTSSLGDLKAQVVTYAQSMRDEDEAINRAMGANGAPLLVPGSRVLTHCNTGSLATAYFGTALGVVYTAFDQGRVGHVWVCETRPVNQGGRLTAWELMVTGIPSTLICDDMAASVMSQGWVDAVLVGADRICSNGDTANKIGTLGLAILARAFDIPFYVVAPTSSIDMTCSSGDLIEIERRDSREVEGVTVTGLITPTDAASVRAFDLLTEKGDTDLSLKNGHQMSVARKGGAYRFDAWFKTTPPGVAVYNPAFDITPSKYITAIITEKGVSLPDESGVFHLDDVAEASSDNL